MFTAKCPPALPACLLLLLWLGLPGCGGPATLAPENPDAQLQGSLPPLPVGRAASLTLKEDQTGAEFYLKSANSSVSGDRLELDSSASTAAWGIWAFAPDEDALSAAEILVSVPAGQQAFVALSDYVLGSWDIRGPVTGNVQYDISSAENLSPDGVTFVAVVTSSSATSEVIQLEFTTERTGWQVVDVDSQYWTGFTPSLAVVDGNPAIAYRGYNSDNTACMLKYVRSTTPDGSVIADWIDPIDIYAFSGPGLSFDESNNCSLAVIDGLPAIAYIDDSQEHVLCSFSVSMSGDKSIDWNHAVRRKDKDIHRLFEYVSLIEVQGNPTVCVYDSESKELVYRYALDNLSDEVMVAVDQGVMNDDGNPHSLRLIDGKPAIVFGDRNHSLLKYARSSTDTGASADDWTQVETIDNVLVDSVSLATVLGNPAVAYWDRTEENLKYMRATNPSGEGAWPADPVTVDGTYGNGSSCGLLDLGGGPEIGYSDWLVGDYLYLKSSSSATGSTQESWGSGDPGEVVYDHSANMVAVADVNGQPAMAWHDSITDDLMYAIYLD